MKEISPAPARKTKKRELNAISKRNKLTPKERAFVQHIIEHPKDTITNAYLSAYDVTTTNKNTIQPEASRTASRPQVVSALAQYNDLIESTLISAVSDYSHSEDINQRRLAVDTSKFIHDKVHGKSIARTVNLSSDITLQDALELLK